MSLFKGSVFVILMCVQVWGTSSLAAENSEKIKSIFEKQGACGRFVRFDQQNLYLGFSGGVQAISLATETSQRLATGDSAIDMLTIKDTAYILTKSSLEEWSLSSASRLHQYNTYAKTAEMAYQEHPQGLALFKDKIIIAHGRLGISIFNTSTKRLVNQFRLLKWQMPYESMATGVAVAGQFAYVVVDNFHLVKPPAKAPFRGIIVIDMESEKVVAELDGMDPGVTSVVADGNILLASFGGSTIWKYSAASLKGKTVPEPLLRVWNYPFKGHPTGLASVDDKYYYTCYLKAPAQPGENGGIYKNVPTALDRQILMMD